MVSLWRLHPHCRDTEEHRSQLSGPQRPHGGGQRQRNPLLQADFPGHENKQHPGTLFRQQGQGRYGGPHEPIIKAADAGVDAA